MSHLRILFAIVVALSVLNVGVFAGILELGMTIDNNRCKSACVRENNNDQSYWNDSYADFHSNRCVCQSRQANACKNTCFYKYNSEAFRAHSYIQNGNCICKSH